MNTRTLIESTVAAIALTFALGASTAIADTPAKKTSVTKKATSTTAKAKKPKVKTLIFGAGDDVEGGVVTPDGDTVNARGNVVHSSLITVREHFIPEIFKSAEDL